MTILQCGREENLEGNSEEEILPMGSDEGENYLQ